MVANAYWEELAREAETYLTLLRKLERMPVGSSKRERCEDEMVSCLSHLAVHSAVLYRSVDEVIERLSDGDDATIDELGLESDEPEEAEAGLRDPFSEAEQAVERLNLLLRKLSATATRMGSELGGHAERVTAANEAGSTQGARPAVNEASSTIDAYAADLGTDIPELRRSVARLSGSIMEFVGWLRENHQGDAEARESLIRAITTLRAAMPETYRQTDGLRRVVEDLPKATRDLARARNRLTKKLVAVLDTFEELEAFADRALVELAR